MKILSFPYSSIETFIAWFCTTGKCLNLIFYISMNNLTYINYFLMKFRSIMHPARNNSKWLVHNRRGKLEFLYQSDSNKFPMCVELRTGRAGQLKSEPWRLENRSQAHASSPAVVLFKPNNLKLTGKHYLTCLLIHHRLYSVVSLDNLTPCTAILGVNKRYK